MGRGEERKPGVVVSGIACDGLRCDIIRYPIRDDDGTGTRWRAGRQAGGGIDDDIRGHHGRYAMTSRTTWYNGASRHEGWRCRSALLGGRPGRGAK